MPNKQNFRIWIIVTVSILALLLVAGAIWYNKVKEDDNKKDEPTEQTDKMDVDSKVDTNQNPDNSLDVQNIKDPEEKLPPVPKFGEK